MRKSWILFLVLLALLGLGLFLDVNAGYSQIPLRDILEILGGGGVQAQRYTLLELRLPRVITSMLVGMALALSGALLQGITHNDMADPGILGLNAGSGLAIALVILGAGGLFASYGLMLPAAALTGALATGWITTRLSMVGQRVKPGRLLLIGVAVSMALNALSSMVMLRLPDSQYAFVQNWIAGSLWGADWQNAGLLALGILVFGGYAIFCSWTLNVLGLGEEAARGLGVDVQRVYRRFLIAACALSALACAAGGGLAFVGLICPHLARRLAGWNHRRMLPAACLLGGGLLVYADIISRTLLLPAEIPVGIVSAVIGAPYFLYLLVKKR